MRKLGPALGGLGLTWVLFVACGGSSTESLCTEDQIFSDGKCFEDLGVAVNGVGMLPTRIKRAAFAGEDGEFEVVDVKTGSVALSGTASGPLTARDTEQVVYLADFTELTQPGRYFVRTAQGKKSSEFDIGHTGLEGALQEAMLGLYGQRCGVAIDFEFGDERYRHAACHLDEASLEDVGGGSADDTGGWHDAGDYGKYVVNGAFAVAFLVAAYEHYPQYLREVEFAIPESGGALPDILDEAQVELKWILKTQFADGSFSHKVTARHFEAELMPEADRQPRYFYTPSTAATGDAVGALAQAARVFKEFDADFADKCLDAAIKGQQYLDAHPEEVKTMLTPDGTGAYQSGEANSDGDARVWALSELWETTGEANYLTQFETRAQTASFGVEFDWGNATNLGLGTYLRSKRQGRDAELVTRLTASLATGAQTLHAASLDDVYGRDRPSYYWGTNGVICRTAYNLGLAHSLFGNTDFLDAASLQVGHVLGMNGFGRSYVTQLGPNPVMQPHHRPSQSDSAGKPWPGLLIGGPHGQGADERGTTDINPALDWQDISGNYYHNEIAINWNTALVYALVATLATENDETAACWPDDCFEVPDATGPDGAGGMGGGAP